MDLTDQKQDELNRQAVIYCRVSTLGQENEGFSIPSQKRLLEEYASKNGFKVDEYFIEAESASLAGRKRFGEMLNFIQNCAGRVHVLVEKPDRLYRNFQDQGAIKDLIDSDRVEVHFVRENLILNKDSAPTAFLAHDIGVVVAANNKRQLKRESSKGTLEKAKGGYWPYKPKCGYIAAIDNNTGKKTMVPDPAAFEVLRLAFECYATGNFSVVALADHCFSLGLVGRRGRRLSAQQLNMILRDKAYAGYYMCGGVEFEATKYEPLVSLELWHRVQTILGERHKTKKKDRAKKNFAYSSSLFNCDVCGCAIVGEEKIKKSGKRFSYFHCTMGKRKTIPDHKAAYVPLKLIERAIIEMLKTMRFSPVMIEKFSKAYGLKHANQKEAGVVSVGQLERRLTIIDRSLGTLVDKLLAGTIDDDLYGKMKDKLKGERDAIALSLQNIKSFKQPAVLGDISLPRLLEVIPIIYTQQPPATKKRFLKLLISRATLNAGGLHIEVRPPFNLILQPSIDLPFNREAA